MVEMSQYPDDTDGNALRSVEKNGPAKIAKCENVILAQSELNKIAATYDFNCDGRVTDGNQAH